MPSKYKAKWETGHENREFWEEVLVGRTIKELQFTGGDLVSFVLDSGEVVLLAKGPENRPTIAIKDDV